MQHLDLISEPGRSPTELARMLADHFVVKQLGIETIRSRPPGQTTIFDISVNDTLRNALLKSWLSVRPPHAKTVIVLDTSGHLELARARTIGAEKIVVRPVAAAELLDYLLGAPPQQSPRPPLERPSLEVTVSHGAGTLDSIFSSARSGQPPDMKAVSKASEQIVEQIGVSGLSDWVELVRRHHNRTYQHCLLVTGVAVAFARHLGFSAGDQARISFAGMIHDLGKARVPLAILEKPAALDEDEWRIMRRHPQYGIEALSARADVPSAIRDVVLHHHEYLDGSGYPEGLRGGQISDVVRMMTIADIFGALLEARSYKPPMSGPAAYEVLLGMGQKLDSDMVREFSAVALENGGARDRRAEVTA